MFCVLVEIGIGIEKEKEKEKGMHLISNEGFLVFCVYALFIGDRGMAWTVQCVVCGVWKRKEEKGSFSCVIWGMCVGLEPEVL